MVPKVGVEPTRPRGRQILSLVRLPFRHFGNLYICYYTIVTVKIKSKAEENAFFFQFLPVEPFAFSIIPVVECPGTKGIKAISAPALNNAARSSLSNVSTV